MAKENLKIAIGFILFTIISCGQHDTMKETKWLTMKTEYEGSPLYLRKPDYKEIWNYKENFTNLLCITHSLDKVTNNGLPEPDYNLSLMEFDESLVKLFDSKKEGIIILIETFGGERNYWFYISNETEYQSKIEKIKIKYPSNKIETNLKYDKDWNFINKYPIKLYEKL